MSVDLAAVSAAQLAVVGAFVGIMLWFRKDIKEYFCKDIDELKTHMQRIEDRQTTLVQKLLENDLDLGSRIAWLEGKTGGDRK